MPQLAPLLATLSVGFASSHWAPLAIAGLWLLPDWVLKWLDVRDRWKGPGP